MSKNDTDDVMDFINSLPDSKGATPAAAAKPDDDFMDFLDELTAHEKTAKPLGVSRGKFEPKKRDESATPISVARGETPVVSGDAKEAAPPKTPSLPEQVQPEPLAKPALQEAVADEPASDPIASISSWWTSEGSLKVSSLWGLLTSNAHQLSETTYQLASNTSQQLSHQRQKFLKENSVTDPEHMLHLTDKLNSILTTMSQQIKDGLIDKEDELLNILLVYDLNNLSYLDALCAAKFNQVMDQVEGGIKTTVSNFNHKQTSAEGLHCDLDLFHGKPIDAEKLCYANLDSSVKDYLKISELDEQSEVEINKSNVFIAIQPFTTGQENPSDDAKGPTVIEANNPSSFAFTMILRDITNNITILSKSQPFPIRWARWLSGRHEDVVAAFGDDEVDPAEWVKDWIHDGLGLTFAVLAQEYVSRRMGI